MLNHCLSEVPAPLRVLRVLGFAAITILAGAAAVATLPGQAPPPAPPKPAAQAAAAAVPGAIPGIRAFTHVSDRVTLGGAVEPSAYPLLKQAGYVAVINLRTAAEAGADIEGAKAAAGAVGLTYIHVPFDKAGLTAGTVDTFLKAVSDPANQPVLVHCAGAVRASLMWAIKRAVQDGWPVEEALGEFPWLARSVPEAYRTFAREYIKKRGREGF